MSKGGPKARRLEGTELSSVRLGAEERQVTLTREEGDAHDSAQVFRKFSRCGKSNIEDHIAN